MSEGPYKPYDPLLAARAAYQASVPISRLEANTVVQRAGVIDNTRPAGSAAEGGSSSLEESTLKGQLDAVRFPENPSGAHYRCTLKDFGQGRVVCTGVYLDSSVFRRKVSSERAPAKLVAELPEFFVAERSEFARRRARRTLREKIWMLRADRMLTLTKRGKFPTTDDAWKAWHHFCKLARKFWGPRWQFVVVPEAHKEGGFHLHVALHGFFDVGMLRRFWARALGGSGNESGADTRGNVDITGAVASPRSRARIANYLGKYLSKDLVAVLRGRRALASSRGIPAPRIVRWNQAITTNVSQVGIAQRKLSELVDTRLDAMGWWEFSLGGFHGFVISPLE
jgi:hypothetical protein